MTKREHLVEIQKQLSRESSPYKPGLLALLQELNGALIRHERFVRETRKGRNPNESRN